MRITAGPIRHRTPDGRAIWLDEVASLDHLDFMLRAIAAAGQTIETTRAVQWDAEGGPIVVEWFHDGVVQYTAIDPPRRGQAER